MAMTLQNTELIKVKPVKAKKYKTGKSHFTEIFWCVVISLLFLAYFVVNPNSIFSDPPESANTDINVHATPYWHGAPLAFTVTVIEDTNVEMTWANQADATGTMIRVGFDDYPATPTDGYLVYSGTDLTTHDLANNLDKNGEAFYSAWHLFDGAYSADYAEGHVEGAGMTAIAGNMLFGIELVFALIMFGLALWRYDPWLYLIVAGGLALMGFQWYPDYNVIGIIMIGAAGFCLYKTVRYFVD